MQYYLVIDTHTFPHTSGECEASQLYVSELQDVLAHCAPKAGVAAFIAEAIQVVLVLCIHCIYMCFVHVYVLLHVLFVYVLCFQGVGGTVQLPRGYLKRAYETIRANGGVCISDEVSLSYIATACKH